MSTPRPSSSRLIRVAKGAGLLLGIVFAAAALAIWYHLFRTPAYAPLADPAEHFKYGSISNKRGVPLYVWEVMPELFRDQLPGGLASIGLLVEPNRPVPIGFGVRTVGYPGLTVNCGLCHVGSYRTSPEAPPQIVLGAPGHQFDFARFQKFAIDCARDPRFTGPRLVAEIKKRHALGPVEQLVYRWLLIPGLRKQLLASEAQFAWTHSRPPAGPGRTDAFNGVKIGQLGLPDDGTIGTSDFPPLWAQRKRAGFWLHWNGGGNQIASENLFSALAAIEDAVSFDARSFTVVTNFISALPAPAFPFPVDAALAARGQTLFSQHCADCHAFGGRLTGQVTPSASVGTDPAFLKMWTASFVQKVNAIDQPPFRFGSMRLSDGYANVLLDGCWLRAPYLHNGSVPTLWDLLQPATARPKLFSRGDDLYDAVKLGFSSDTNGGARPRFLYDTALPGNGNHGHEYGTTLSDAEKRALLEHLKTL